MNMTNNVLLNNVDHKDLKVITERSEKYGDNVWYAITFPLEFRSVQAYYPIFFTKDANTGEFFPAALFGFEHQDNLFLKDDKWDAGYIPLVMQRGPFTIGKQTVNDSGQNIETRVLTLDTDNPRVNKEQGEDLFLEYGGNTPYLEKAAEVMENIHLGLENSKSFVNFLLEYEILEPFTLDITLNNQSKNEMIGFYTINEEKFHDISTDIIAKLHNEGYLHAIYMVLASHGNIRDLMNRKIEKLGL